MGLEYFLGVAMMVTPGKDIGIVNGDLSILFILKLGIFKNENVSVIVW